MVEELKILVEFLQGIGAETKQVIYWYFALKVFYFVGGWGVGFLFAHYIVRQVINYSMTFTFYGSLADMMGTWAPLDSSEKRRMKKLLALGLKAEKEEKQI